MYAHGRLLNRFCIFFAELFKDILLSRVFLELYSENENRASKEDRDQKSTPNPIASDELVIKNENISRATQSSDGTELYATTTTSDTSDARDDVRPQTETTADIFPSYNFQYYQNHDYVSLSHHSANSVMEKRKASSLPSTSPTPAAVISEPVINNVKQISADEFEEGAEEHFISAGDSSVDSGEHDAKVMEELVAFWRAGSHGGVDSRRPRRHGNAHQIIESEESKSDSPMSYSSSDGSREDYGGKYSHWDSNRYFSELSSDNGEKMNIEQSTFRRDSDTIDDFPLSTPRKHLPAGVQSLDSTWLHDTYKDHILHNKYIHQYTQQQSSYPNQHPQQQDFHYKLQNYQTEARIPKQQHSGANNYQSHQNQQHSSEGSSANIAYYPRADSAGLGQEFNLNSAGDTSVRNSDLPLIPPPPDQIASLRTESYLAQLESYGKLCCSALCFLCMTHLVALPCVSFVWIISCCYHCY